MTNKPRGIYLPEKSWQAWEQLAEETGSFPQRGKNAGRVASVDTLMRRISENPKALGALQKILNTAVPLDMGQFLPPIVMRPEKPPRTETIATVSIAGNAVRVHFPEKREDFGDVVKAFDCHWSPPYWQRDMDKLSGSVADRAAELCRRLLDARFCVLAPSAEVQQMAATGEFQKETRRWVQVVIKGEYKGWFLLGWRYSEDCYEAAKRITASRYDKPYVVVPQEHYDQVLDFAQRYGFHVSPAAAKLAELAKIHRSQQLVVSATAVTEIPQNGRPVLEVPNEVWIDELADDDYAI